MEVQKAQTHRNMIANPHHFPAEEGSCLEVAGPLPKVTEAVGGNARMKTQGPKTLGPGCFSLPWSHFSEAEAKYLLLTSRKPQNRDPEAVSGVPSQDHNVFLIKVDRRGIYSATVPPHMAWVWIQKDSGGRTLSPSSQLAQDELSCVPLPGDSRSPNRQLITA